MATRTTYITLITAMSLTAVIVLAATQSQPAISTMQWTEPIDYHPTWRIEGTQSRTLTGYAKPGQTLDLIFYATSNNYDKAKIKMDYRLIEETSQSLVANRVESEVGPSYHCWWQIQLPNQAPAKYLFGVTATDENGTLVAVMIEEIKVPKQEIAVDLRVDLGEVTTQDSIMLLVANNGETNIGFGYEYHIEKLVNGSWWRIPMGLVVWPMVLHTMGPGGSGSTEAISVRGLDSGSYRVAKEFQAEGVNGTRVLYAGFTVNRPPDEDFSSLPKWGFDYSIQLAEQSSESPDYPMLWLSNDGARSLLIGSGYRLERLVSGAWEPFYELDTGGNVSVVKWGEVYSQVFNGTEFSIGRYRVFKDIGVDGFSIGKVLVLEFDYTKPG